MMKVAATFLFGLVASVAVAQELEVAPAAVVPQSLVITVGSVRVKGTRPEGGGTWDDVAQPAASGANPWCGLLKFAHVVPGVGTTAATGGAVLCSALAGGPGQQAQRDPRAPDLFVALVAGQDSTYRTHVAADSFAAFFQSRFRVPVAAIPPLGLRFFVQDDDGPQGAETIGEILVQRDDLLAAVAARKPLILTDETGAVQRLELAVEPREPRPIERSVNVDTSMMFPLPDLYVDAGTAVWVLARGEYRAGPLAGTRKAAGLRGLTQNVIRTAPFSSAPHGAAIGLLGAGQTMTPLVVGDCVGTIVQTPGRLALGVNDDDLGNNVGSLAFTVVIFDAGPENWAKAGQPVPCSRLTEIIKRRRGAPQAPPLVRPPR
jgi:hypothetical protein